MTETHEASLSDELLAYVYEAFAVMPAAQRRNAHWVMNLEWFSEVRRLDDRRGAMFWAGAPLGKPEYLLGVPIEVREDGGAPHLEPGA